jgi:hypothetical protein
MEASGAAEGELQVRRRTVPRLVSLAVKVIVTVGALYLAFRSVDVGLLAGRLARINLPLFGVAVLGVLVQIVLVAMRWRLVVRRLDRAHGPSPALATAINFSCQFANQFLPLAGDALRALLGVRAGIRARFAITSAVVDRGMALVVLLLLTIPSLLLWRLVMPAPLLSMSMLLVAVALLAGFVLVLAIGLPLIVALPRRMQAPVAAILEDTRLVFLNPATGYGTAGLSLAVHLISVGVVWVLSLAVATPISPVMLLVLVPPMLFATMLPFTVSGWGAREGAVVWFLSATGTPSDGAFLLSVSFGAALLVAALPGAVAWFGLVRQTS